MSADKHGIAETKKAEIPLLGVIIAAFGQL